MKPASLGVLLIPAVSLLLPGCSEKLTYQRWETIHDGMNPEAVEATLGEPWHKTDKTWLYSDDDRGIYAHIYFDGGKVISKKWTSPEVGIKGRSPNVNQPGDAEEVKVQKLDIQK
ncbi:MAG TPA: hypothetical protein PKY77_01620 [Phycisphaerae bacterium]|nr:hypothetical protein [Phycisphaerae bacterium]HRY68016.1 hypothetical protein [Phycisphaerae bacterium]HSA26753.1 hypothetical protein [Phycisphaerae bacterium]